VVKYLFDERIPRWLLPAVWCAFAAFATCVAIAGWIFESRTERVVRASVDEQLRIAVTMAAELFPRDLRGRATSAEAISKDEDQRNTALATRLCRDARIAYLYGLFKAEDGHVRTLWSSDDNGEVGTSNGEWYWESYDDCATAAVESMMAGEGLRFATYGDRWGHFRGAYLGQRDSAGRPYVVGADIAMSQLDATLTSNRRNVALAVSGAGLAGLLLAIGLHLLIRRLDVARRDLDLLAEVARATGHAVLLADAEGVVRWANEACRHHLARDAAALLGQPLRELLAAAPAETLANAMLQGGSCDLAGPGAPAADWLQADLRQVTHPRGSSWTVCLLHDLSQRRATEQELRRARGEAERTAAAKSAFLANISHEIRTPLNGMLGMTDLLLDGKDLTPRQRELLGVSRRSGEELLELLTNILDLTKMEAQAMTIDPRPCDLVGLVQDAASLFRAGAESRNLTIDVHTGGLARLWVRADPVRMRQMLANLIGNAVKFTEHGGITATLTAVPDGTALTAMAGMAVTIAITDTGVGIPQDRQDELFQPFAQVDASLARRAGGSGMGLAISRRLVGLMGGTLELQSGAGIGSTFTIRLRLDTANGSFEERPGLKAGARRGRVLIADGNRNSRTVASLMLRKLGVLEIEQADDAAGAVAASTGSPCDLILLDVALPGGAEALRHALQLSASSSRPVPMIAVVDPGVSPPSGYAGCVVRPLTAETLRPLLDRWCPTLPGPTA